MGGRGAGGARGGSAGQVRRASALGLQVDAEGHVTDQPPDEEYFKILELPDGDRVGQYRTALESYTGDNYQLINEALYNPSSINELGAGQRETVIREIRRIREVVGASPKFENTMYRGSIGGKELNLSEISIGGSVRTGAFLSTSSNRQTASSFLNLHAESDSRTRVLWNISGNKSGASIDRFSSNRGEGEVLVPPHVTYRVTRIRRMKASPTAAYTAVEVFLEEE